MNYLLPFFTYDNSGSIDAVFPFAASVLESIESCTSFCAAVKVADWSVNVALTANASFKEPVASDKQEALNTFLDRLEIIVPEDMPELVEKTDTEVWKEIKFEFETIDTL